MHRFAESFYDLALPLIILSVTGSPVAMAATFIAGYLAEMVASPVAGKVVGRVGRKHLLLTLVSVEILATLSLSGQAYLGLLSTLSIVAHAAIIDFALRIYLIADIEYIPIATPKKLLPRANSWIQAGTSLSQVLGPAAAGGALALMSPPAVLLGSAGVFLVLCVVLSRIKERRGCDEIPSVSNGSLKNNTFRDAWEYLSLTHPTAKLLFIWKGVNDALLAGPMLFLVYLFTELNGVSSGIYGWVAAFMALGGLIAGVVVSLAMRTMNVVSIFFTSSMGIGVAIAILAWYPGLIAAASASVLLMASVVFGGRAWIVHFQSFVDSSYLGRIIALSQLAASITGVMGCVLFASARSEYMFSLLLLIVAVSCLSAAIIGLFISVRWARREKIIGLS